MTNQERLERAAKRFPSGIGFSLTGELQKELIAAIESAPPSLQDLLVRACDKLADVEERLDGMWQEHRWCGD